MGNIEFFVQIFCTNNKLKLIAYERKWHNKKM